MLVLNVCTKLSCVPTIRAIHNQHQARVSGMPLTSWAYVLFHGSGVKLQWLSLVLYITMAVHVQSRGADSYSIPWTHGIMVFRYDGAGE
jgi:hypothetical protein